MKYLSVPVVLALGFFDSLHLGHRKLIARAQARAAECGAEAAVFTFRGDPAAVFGHTEGTVLSLKERLIRLNEMGISAVVFGEASPAYLSRSPEEFLRELDERYEMRGYVCGGDYRYGKNAAGTAVSLAEYAAARGRFCEVAEDVTADGVRVSTSAVRELLKKGDVAAANRLLVAPYPVFGRVFEDRKVGRTLGFPTINLRADPEKTKLKSAVYTGHIALNGKTYRAIVNYGARPTFGLNETLVEAHIDGFSGNLYGEDVLLCLDGYLREICAFHTKEELSLQLKRDLEAIR